jgi:hypothetical protein
MKIQRVRTELPQRNFILLDLIDSEEKSLYEWVNEYNIVLKAVGDRYHDQIGIYIEGYLTGVSENVIVNLSEVIIDQKMMENGNSTNVFTLSPEIQLSELNENEVLNLYLFEEKSVISDWRSGYEIY